MTFEASLNSAGDEISYTLTYSDLEGVLVTNGVVTAAHIHFGQRAVVIAFLDHRCGHRRTRRPGDRGGVIR